MAEWRARVVTAEGKRDERIVIADARDEAVVRLIAQGDTPLQVRTGPLSLREGLVRPNAPVVKEGKIGRHDATFQSA
ncbi:hypothetical protein, partial [Sphingomicrobium arenosum]|uniref:hypothetical protein n=1 Tax=Sphingomicrobium arenosum TaxID=2233861 RepID=UPI002240FD0B